MTVHCVKQCRLVRLLPWTKLGVVFQVTALDQTGSCFSGYFLGLNWDSCQLAFLDQTGIQVTFLDQTRIQVTFLDQTGIQVFSGYFLGLNWDSFQVIFLY